MALHALGAADHQHRIVQHPKGTLGLSGEIRPVAQTERRIIEAARLGFRRIFVSSFSSLEGLEEQCVKGIEVVKVSDVPSLCRALFKS